MKTNGYGREDEIYTHKFAGKSYLSKGREKEIGADYIRTEYQRDSHRIYYSQPFRRLRHKTQVFYRPDNDHISTRLEHALFVSSAARTIARALKLNEDLAEAIALGHDLGHAPFGHHGEAALDDICKTNKIRPVFHHEVNSLRVIDKLAQLDREDTPGLNLTFEVRDGIISHNGEDFSQSKIVPFSGKKDLGKIVERNEAKNPSTLEGCIVRISDIIAYAGRDIEDAIQARLICPSDIPGDITSTLGDNNGAIVGSLIEDIIKNSPPDEFYIAMSGERYEALKKLMKFNLEKIYYHKEVQKYKNRVNVAISNLFNLFVETLSKTKRFKDRNIVNGFSDIFVYNTFEKFVKEIGYSEQDSNEQIAVDFISGFTDNFVIKAVNDFFVPESII